ncbi:hypothetical protein MYX82_14315, partial [Acidobacteria bacterium AH-259-D05]|nr:hypothetical protein [Acidobacteria bacterium AH-259-D05]
TLQGNAIFQWKAGDILIDSVGVQAGTAYEHFSFTAEKRGGARTGLALSNAQGDPVTMIMKAFSDMGALLDTTAITLQTNHHVDFFIDEELSVPEGFLGTVEVEADNFVTPLVIRVEGNQLSTIDVSPMVSIYSFEIVLDDGRRFSGTMKLWVQGAVLAGFVQFTSPPSDTEFTIMTGAAGGGVLLSTTFYVAGSEAVVIELIGLGGFATQDSNFTANVAWFSAFGNRTGFLTATRLN